VKFTKTRNSFELVRKPFLGVLALLFLLSPLSLLANRKTVDKSVVSINDEVILQSDITEFIDKNKSKNYRELFGGMDPKLLNDREAVLNHLIEDKIINQQVKKLELQVNDQEVEGQIRAIKQRNQISEQQLKERIKQLGTTLAEYKEAIKKQLERKNLVEREIRPTIELSDEKLRHFYLRTHGDKGEKVYKISHIFVSGTGPKSLERIKKIYSEVKEKPSEFDKFIAEYSDDSSGNPQGLLGEFTIAALAKEFREKVPTTPVGSFTEPIRTKIGYHVVKVLNTDSSTFSTLSKEKKEELRNHLMAEEMEKKMGLWIERKKQESFIRKHI